MAERATQDEQLRKAEWPQVTVEQAKDFVEKNYGIVVKEIKELDSYDDRNFYVVTLEGTKHVFKVHNGVESLNLPFVHAQIDALSRLDEAGLAVPCAIPALNGSATTFLELPLKDGVTKRNHATRLLKWVEGQMLADVKQPLELMYKLGVYFGKMSLILREVDLEATHRTFAWDLFGLPKIRPFSAFATEERKVVLESVIIAFETEVVPLQDILPRQLCQNDGNDRNIVIDETGAHVAGVIDFGDLIYTWRVSELAILMAYLTLNKSPHDSLAAIAAIYAGFNGITALTAEEMKVLRTLVASRLTQSISMSAFSFSKNPENTYLLLHAEPAWTALKNLWQVTTQDDFDAALRSAAAQKFE